MGTSFDNFLCKKYYDAKEYDKLANIWNNQELRKEFNKWSFFFIAKGFCDTQRHQACFDVYMEFHKKPKYDYHLGQNVINAMKNSFYNWFFSDSCAEQAYAYALTKGLPHRLETSNISEFVSDKDTFPAFNNPINIPPEIEREICQIIDPPAVKPSEISTKTRGFLIDNRPFQDNRKACYRGATAKLYIASYLPMHFYKIWIPLSKLLENHRLPLKAEILELGAGPGTTGLSLFHFYFDLAKSNPTVNFSLSYTAVEIEQDFIDIHKRLTATIKNGNLPQNMDLTLNSIVKTDAFEYMRNIKNETYDLVIESNLLNSREAINGENKRDFQIGLRNGLRKGGFALFVEPTDAVVNLKNLLINGELDKFFYLDNACLDVSRIELLNFMYRNSKQYSYRFFATWILEKKINI